MKGIKIKTALILGIVALLVTTTIPSASIRQPYTIPPPLQDYRTTAHPSTEKTHHLPCISLEKMV